MNNAKRLKELEAEMFFAREREESEQRPARDGKGPRRLTRKDYT
jgi:hypothetical protein